MSFDAFFSGPGKYGDSDNSFLAKIWYWLARLGGGIPGQGGIVIGSSKLTYTFTPIGNSGSGSIPTTAKGWSIVISPTGGGTCTVGGATVFNGYAVSDSNSPVVAIAVTTDSSSTAVLGIGS